MPEILEIKQTETEETQETSPNWDSWTVEIPPEIVEAQELAEGSLAILTVRNGKVEGEITYSSPETKVAAKRILEKRREVFEELKRLGD